MNFVGSQQVSLVLRLAWGRWDLTSCRLLQYTARVVLSPSVTPSFCGGKLFLKERGKCLKNWEKVNVLNAEVLF